MATYREAGVDIDSGARAVELMRGAVQATHGPEVLAGIGAFGGLYDLSAAEERRAPVLVASTDGVGTKTKIAAILGRWDTIGHDIVNHCVNDILVQGARPLFFLDYVAASRLDPGLIATVVRGCAAACGANRCALLGGETAEMPGVYAEGALDLVGTIVGIVEREAIIDGTSITAGDAVIGLASSGLHTNGFTLAREVIADLDLTAVAAGLDEPLGDALLRPHRSYLTAVERLRAAVDIRGLVHITGGGLIDNPPRILPEAVAMRLVVGSWEVPPVFGLLQEAGQIPDAEMRRVFNVGLGMLCVIPAADADRALETVAADDMPRAFRVGEIIPRRGESQVEIVG